MQSSRQLTRKFRSVECNVCLLSVILERNLGKQTTAERINQKSMMPRDASDCQTNRQCGGIERLHRSAGEKWFPVDGELPGKKL